MLDAQRCSILLTSIVDVDGGNLELALLEELVQVMNAGCGLF